jgi:GT2 family glycosyltransferase
VQISVVIANWNGRAFLGDCLGSLAAAEAALDAETIVVDNGSTDGSVDFVRERFPSVRLIPLGANRGFAAANNRGIAASVGRYVCLVNSDVVVPEGCLEALFRCMEIHPAVGILSPMIVGRDGRPQQFSRNVPTIGSSVLEAFGVELPVRRCTDGGPLEDVGVLSGCFLMLRRTALEREGGLDERFFFYGEDVDLCRRYGRARWRVCCLPGTTATHYGGASSRGAPGAFQVQLTRARLQYWRKNGSRMSGAIYYAVALFHNGVRCLLYGLAACVPARGRSLHAGRRDVFGSCLRYLRRAARRGSEHC